MEGCVLSQRLFRSHTYTVCSAYHLCTPHDVYCADSQRRTESDLRSSLRPYRTRKSHSVIVRLRADGEHNPPEFAEGNLNICAQRGLEPPVWILSTGSISMQTCEAPEHRIRALMASLGLAAGPQTPVVFEARALLGLLLLRARSGAHRKSTRSRVTVLCFF